MWTILAIRTTHGWRRSRTTSMTIKATASVISSSMPVRVQHYTPSNIFVNIYLFHRYIKFINIIGNATQATMRWAFGGWIWVLSSSSMPLIRTSCERWRAVTTRTGSEPRSRHNGCCVFWALLDMLIKLIIQSWAELHWAPRGPGLTKF